MKKFWYVLVLILGIVVLTGCPLLGEDPTIPTQVTASQGTNDDYVRITWDSKSSETYYVYRGDASIGLFSSIASRVAGSSYDDTSVVRGQHYYYFVKAADEYGESITTKSSTVEGWSKEPDKLVIDIKDSYFTDLSSTYVDVYVNNNKVGTITNTELGGINSFSQFEFPYSGDIESIRIDPNNKAETIFDTISDFASNPPASISSMKDIKKIVLYPVYNTSSNLYTGTEAYLGPRKHSFSISDVTDASIEVTADEYESPENLNFNIYLSTDSGSTFTQYNSSSLTGATLYDGYTLTGLNSSTAYTITLEAVYDGIVSVRADNGVFTTEKADRIWTIMVWLDGDNNLNDAAIEDFHEMEYGLYLAQQNDPDILDRLSVIVQYDENSSYETVPTDPGRYDIKPRSTLVGDTVGLPSDSSYTSISEPNMGSASELQSFIDWGKTNYEADNYALILWNHGGGVRSFEEDSEPVSKAICWDDSNGDDALYVGEIKDYLDSTHSVDFLGMDACLMGFLEVAYEFRPGTDDFGAQAMSFSPATEQGDGWEYQSIFSRMSGRAGNDNQGHPYYAIETMTPQNFASIVAQEYEDAFIYNTWETQTAVDLTKIATVKTRLDALAALIDDSKSDIEDIRDGTAFTGSLMAYFDTDDASQWNSYAGFDLYSLATRIKAENISDVVNTAAESLKTAVEDAIIYSWGHPGGSGSFDGYDDYVGGFTSGQNGLSIFFPAGDYIYDSNNNNVADTNEEIYWYYQDWYNGVSHDSYQSWWQDDLSQTGTRQYGALDFCTSDGDGEVESWFELLQYWYNPSNSTPNIYNPSPLE